MPCPTVPPVGANITSDERDRKARIAVSLLFLANGLSLSVWLPRLAEIQASLNMSDATLGIVLACAAVGGLLFGPWAGVAAARWGSGRTAIVTLLLFAPLVPLIAIVPNAFVLALLLAWLGGMDAVMDAAMNAHGIRVQKHYQRSILNSFHGYWSLGTVIGGGLGALSAALGIPLLLSLLTAAVIAVACGIVAAGWTLPGKDPDSHLVAHDDDVVDATGAAVDPGSVPLLRTRSRIPLSPTLILIGLFTLLAVVVEDVPARWSSIYLTSIGTSEQWAGFAFVAFTTAMMVGRFTGDFLVNRFGEIRVVRVSMIATALALIIGLASANAWGFIGACVVTGYGVATLFPAAMRAAAHLPGVRPATGVAMASWLSRAGFVTAPFAVGLIAEGFGPGWGIATAALAALGLVALASVLRWGSSPSVPSAH